MNETCTYRGRLGAIADLGDTKPCGLPVRGVGPCAYVRSDDGAACAEHEPHPGRTCPSCWPSSADNGWPEDKYWNTHLYQPSAWEHVHAFDVGHQAEVAQGVRDE